MVMECGRATRDLERRQALPRRDEPNFARELFGSQKLPFEKIRSNTQNRAKNQKIKKEKKNKIHQKKEKKDKQKNKTKTKHDQNDNPQNQEKQKKKL